MGDPISMAVIGAGAQAIGSSQQAGAQQKAAEQQAAAARQARDEANKYLQTMRDSGVGNTLGLNATKGLSKGKTTSTPGLFGEDYSMTNNQRLGQQAYGGKAYSRDGMTIDQNLVNQVLDPSINWNTQIDAANNFAGLQSGNLASMMQTAPAAQQFASGVQDFLLQAMNRASPGASQALNTSANNNAAFALGMIPQADRLSITRQAAETGLPGTNRARIGRDIGMMQYQLMNQGQQGAQSLMNTMQQWAPTSAYNPTNFMLGQQDLSNAMFQQQGRADQYRDLFESLQAAANPAAAAAANRDVQLQNQQAGLMTSLAGNLMQYPVDTSAGSFMNALGGSMVGMGMNNAYGGGSSPFSGLFGGNRMVSQSSPATQAPIWRN